MISRALQQTLDRLLDFNPAIVLVGPRQVGKTTLALVIARQRNAVYVDLSRPSDLAKLRDLEQYCRLHADRLLILDEIHQAPEIFASLRKVVEERRWAGNRTGQFMLIGATSIDLLKRSNGTLAGRVGYCELHPFNVLEVGDEELRQLWCRGGFPESYLTQDDQRSLDWRLNFIGAYLQRDLPAFGSRIPAETLRRFCTMLAHNQGQAFNAAALAKSLDVGGVTVGRYLDLMADLLLVRRLQPWTSNLGRRVVKAPKVYVRDSGLCHALLGIRTMDDLLGHPVVGGSWEGFVVENILGVLPQRASFGYYRTAGGADVDLVVRLGGDLWAIEIKNSSVPKVSRGFHSACEDLRPNRRCLVYAGEESFPLSADIKAMTLPDIVELFAEA